MEERAKRKSHVEIEQRKDNIRIEEGLKEKATKRDKRNKIFKALPEQINILLLNVFSAVSAFFIMIAAGFCLMYLWKSDAPAWINILSGCAFIFTMMFFNERLSKE